MSAETPCNHAMDKESFLTYFCSGLKGTKLALLVEMGIIKIKSIDMAMYIITKMW